MSFNTLINNAEIFFLIFARVLALVLTAPLISSSSIPALARAALALMVSYVVFPMVINTVTAYPDSGLQYAFLILGEVLVGIILGLILQIYFTIFQVAGQMFSVQMGFGASQAYDPLSQIQIPLIGQFINLMAMALFLTTNGMQKLFLIGVKGSFERITIMNFVLNAAPLSELLTDCLSAMFSNALLIAFPMLSTLMMISVTMGLLGKAAPQMNLMMVGFPIQISVGLLIIVISAPFLLEKISSVLDIGFTEAARFIELAAVPGGAP